ncbi:MAG: rRNA maturation RNase YbeY [Deltaproteobacteria bacterium]|nr:rRNA maturation RNase YbeY [Deltaproteobacteria bacterium]
MPVDSVVRGRALGVVPAADVLAVKKRLRLALAALDRRKCSCTLVLTDDDEIRALNRDFRYMDRATDVLSFHLQELAGEADPAGDGIHLGDIVISIETARRRAPGKKLVTELERLAIHGLCHLFGHDHKRAKQATVMYALERRLRRLKAASKAPLRSGKRPVSV